jgi:hypothetical protein
LHILNKEQARKLKEEIIEKKERLLMKRQMVVVLLIASLFLFCSSCSTGDLPDKGVAILNPKANDIVQAGASYEIQWKTEPNPEFGAMVTIEFSKNGGKSWEQVEDNVPKDGKYSWSVPTLDSAQCRIRVFSQRRPEYRGTSGLFAVK